MIIGRFFKFKDAEACTFFGEKHTTLAQSPIIIALMIGDKVFEVMEASGSTITAIRFVNSHYIGINKQELPLISSSDFERYFTEVPHPDDVTQAMEFEEITDSDDGVVPVFNPDSLDNLHRASSEHIIELAKAVKDIEQAGYNGGIAQQINALKKYQDVLAEIKQQILDNRPMCS